jgi:hypothetical protein
VHSDKEGSLLRDRCYPSDNDFNIFLEGVKTTASALFIDRESQSLFARTDYYGVPALYNADLFQSLELTKRQHPTPLPILSIADLSLLQSHPYLVLVANDTEGSHDIGPDGSHDEHPPTNFDHDTFSSESASTQIESGKTLRIAAILDVSVAEGFYESGLDVLTTLSLDKEVHVELYVIDPFSDTSSSNIFGVSDGFYNRQAGLSEEWGEDLCSTEATGGVLPPMIRSLCNFRDSINDKNDGKVRDGNDIAVTGATATNLSICRLTCSPQLNYSQYSGTLYSSLSYSQRVSLCVYDIGYRLIKGADVVIALNAHRGGYGAYLDSESLDGADGDKWGHVSSICREKSCNSGGKIVDGVSGNGDGISNCRSRSKHVDTGRGRGGGRGSTIEGGRSLSGDHYRDDADRCLVFRSAMESCSSHSSSSPRVSLSAVGVLQALSNLRFSLDNKYHRDCCSRGRKLNEEEGRVQYRGESRDSGDNGTVEAGTLRAKTKEEKRQQRLLKPAILMYLGSLDGVILPCGFDVDVLLVSSLQTNTLLVSKLFPLLLCFA